MPPYAIPDPVYNIARRAYAATQRAYARVAPTRFKEKHELSFWRSRAAEEGVLSNAHYEYFYTDFFGLTRDDYAGKRVLDIGCGPRGSLEWAAEAAERVGLDPLADEYLKLGADKHAMRYLAAPSEDIPFPDAHFDIVCAFNSLDHVEDADATIAEIKRVTAPGGFFLLIVEVNHEPTPTEPVSFPWSVMDRFTDAFDVHSKAFYEMGDDGIYQQLERKAFYNDADPTDRPAILVAKLQRHA